LIVTVVPTVAEAGVRLPMFGFGVPTVKAMPLLVTPPTVTFTLPLVAPVGTGTEMLVAFQLVGVAAVPLKVTVLEPCVAPKFVPVIVTTDPTVPVVGFKLVIPGAVAETVKAAPLLATPPAVTTTLPLVAPGGTGTTMLVALQLVGVAAVPLNVTELAPWEAPKFVPVMVTAVPTAAETGLRPEMFGVGKTVNATPLLAPPPTVITTLPLVAPDGTGTAMLVALQLVGVAAVPLNVMELVPWEAPKFVPPIVTAVPMVADVGLTLEMFGVGTTVKAEALLAAPPTVTTTFPLVAPAGTGTTILVALQVVGVAVVPLNVTVLLPTVAPKLVPAMVTVVPTAAEAGLRLEIWGVAGGVTVTPKP
jgi:hypothetical protein